MTYKDQISYIDPEHKGKSWLSLKHNTRKYPYSLPISMLRTQLVKLGKQESLPDWYEKNDLSQLVHYDPSYITFAKYCW